MYRLIRNMTRWLLQNEAQAIKTHATDVFLDVLKEYDAVFVDGTPVLMTDHAIERLTSRDMMVTNFHALIQGHLGQLDVRSAIQSSPVRWDEDMDCSVPVRMGGSITATAVVQEGQKLIPVYEAGYMVVNIRTFLSKQYASPNYFMVGTRVLFLSRDGEVLETVDVTEGSKNRPDRRYVQAHGRAMRAYH